MILPQNMDGNLVYDEMWERHRITRASSRPQTTSVAAGDPPLPSVCSCWRTARRGMKRVRDPRTELGVWSLEVLEKPHVVVVAFLFRHIIHIAVRWLLFLTGRTLWRKSRSCVRTGVLPAAFCNSWCPTPIRPGGSEPSSFSVNGSALAWSMSNMVSHLEVFVPISGELCQLAT